MSSRRSGRNPSATHSGSTSLRATCPAADLSAKRSSPRATVKFFRTSRQLSTGGLTCRCAVFCWNWRRSSNLTLRWPVWSAATRTQEICWIGFCITPACCAVRTYIHFLSGHNSALSCSGRWDANTPTKSARPSSDAAACITNSKKITRMHSRAIPRAATTPRCRICWCATRSCTPAWGITARWRTTIAACRNPRSQPRRP